MTTPTRAAQCAGFVAHPEQRLRAVDKWIASLFVSSIFAVVVFGLLPSGVVSLVGGVQGMLPSTAQGGMLGIAPGYPFAQPPFWLLWIPALSMLVLSVLTFRLPGGYHWNVPATNSNPLWKALLALGAGLILAVNSTVSLFASSTCTPGSSRLAMSMVSLAGAATTSFVAGAYEGPYAGLLSPALIVWWVAIALFAVRGLLGMLRLVPQSWHTEV